MAASNRRANPVRIGSGSGHPVIDTGSPLARLNYFDGKFLRAPDLQFEQEALLTQVRLSTQAGGSGTVHGFDCALGSGDTLAVSGGLAFDGLGRALLMSQGIEVGVRELIAASRQSPPERRAGAELGARAEFEDCPIRVPELGDDSVVTGAAYYLIVLQHVEAYCGEEDVYGKLCSEACVSETARSHVVEGVELRAVPVSLSLKTSSLPFDNRHLRSRAASALFEKERTAIASLITGPGLSSDIWCLGAEPSAGEGVAIALLGRSGSSTLFLDAWAGRRERIDTPPQQYWSARMSMRSHRVFLAQVAQFQCQLRDCLANASEEPGRPALPGDPCAEQKALLESAAVEMNTLVTFYSTVAERLPERLDTLASGALERPDLAALRGRVEALRRAGASPSSERFLIDCGIVELPSAGYLPVAPSDELTVNEQIRRLLGAGVELRFCVVRPDFVPHALEEARHMERICLLTGIDDPARKQAVDVLVPDGRIAVAEEAIAAGLRAQVTLADAALDIGWPDDGKLSARSGRALHTEFRERIPDLVRRSSPSVSGAARSDHSTNGHAFFLAAGTSPGSNASVVSAELLGRVPDSLRALAGIDDLRARLARDPSGAARPSREEERAAELRARLVEEVRAGARPRAALAALATGTTTASRDIHVSLWVDLHTERDPFGARAGESIAVRAKVIVAIGPAKGDGKVLERRTVTGRLVIERNTAAGAGAEVTARLLADGLWESERKGGTSDQRRVEAIRIADDVVLRRARVAGLPPSVTITLPNPSFFAGLDGWQLVFEQVWLNAGVQRFRGFVRRQSFRSTGIAIAAATTDRIETELFGGELVADERALVPGSVPHSASLRAIGAIAEAADDPSFTESASKALFPPPLPRTERLDILARHPWVLFHRRRDKRCEHDEPGAPPVPPRDYRLLHVRLDASTAIDELVAAIEADLDAVLDGLKSSPVGRVEFASGSPSVATSHAALRGDWQASAGLAADLHVGLIASRGAALDDGLALARARLRSLTDVLEPVGQVADDLELLTVSSVPPGLASGALDGLIIYFTREVVVRCHALYRITGNDALVAERLDGYLAQPGEQTLDRFVRGLEGERLAASPRFVEGTADYYTPKEGRQVEASWNLAGDGPVNGARCISTASGDAAQAVAIEQSAKLVDTVDGDVDEIGHATLPARLLGPCERATLLIVGSRCNEVLVYAPLRAEPLDIAEKLATEFAENGVPGDALGALDESSTRFGRLGSVDFFAGTDELERDSARELRLAWQSLLGGQDPESLHAALIGIGRSAATDVEAASAGSLARRRGDALRNLMGLSAPATLAVLNASDADFPSECEGMTLLVIGRRQSDPGSVVLVRPPRADAVGTPRPSLSIDGATSLAFDADDAIVSEEALAAILDELAPSDRPVENIEIVAIGGEAGVHATARAEAVLAALRTRGRADEEARVIVREPSVEERLEIIGSGFVLDRGLVLR